MQPEANVMRSIQVKVSSIGTRLFRNNVGIGWVGNITKVSIPGKIQINPGDILLKNPRPLHAGLCDGSSDLIGWTPVKITQQMVGKTVAVFTAVEVKTETGHASEVQKNFLETIKSTGGIGLIGRSDESVIEGIHNQIQAL